MSGRSPDDFNTAPMEWIPGRENEVARYKDPAGTGHAAYFLRSGAAATGMQEP